MARDLEQKTNVDGPSGDYPSGKIRNDNGSGNGTPVTEAVYGDFHQFFAKALRDSGITPNNLPDNTTNGFQLNEAVNLASKLYDNENGWTDASFVLSGGWVTDSDYPVQVRKIGQKIEWRGKAYNPATIATGATFISGYDANLRPLSTKIIPCGVINGGARLGALDFRVSGQVILWLPDTPGTDANIILDGISYFV